MLLLINDNVKNLVLDKLKVEYKHILYVTLNNYDILLDKNFHFYLGDSNSSNKLSIVKIDGDSLFKLDYFQHPFYFDKILVNAVANDGNQIAEKVYVYKKIGNNVFCNTTIDEVNKIYNRSHQIQNADLLLLVSGRINDNNTIKLYDNELNHYTRIKNDWFNKHIKNELISDEFVTKIHRFQIGYIKLVIDDDVENTIYKIDAMVELVVHTDMNYCIMEISVPITSIGATKILNYYYPNMIRIEYGNVEMSIGDFAQNMGVELVGSKKSIMFSMEKLSDNHLVNALANQEYVGTDEYAKNQIIGKYKDDSLKNISMYDYSEEYISYNTLIEIYSNYEVKYSDRIVSELQDTFIIEMLLFIDAIVNSIDRDILLEQEDISNKCVNESIINDSLEKIDNISFEMAKALKFVNFGMYNFPVLREFAINVFDRFGIDNMYKRIEYDKQILSQMTETRKRQKEENVEIVRNRFLFVIAAVELFATLGSVIVAFFTDINTMRSYCIALAIITLLYIAYNIMVLVEKRRK